MSGSDDWVGRELADGRFSVSRVLGSGGMGVVYEAYDRERGQTVALKLIVKTPARRPYQLKAEFRSVADVVDRNVLRLHELFCEEEPWFFTMDVVQGVNFLAYVRDEVATSAEATQPTGADPVPLVVSERPLRLSTSRLRSSLEQLVHGLGALHGTGKLHCDIKPSNVLIGADGQLVIVDFGLVTELAAELRKQPSFVSGTPGYIAPERFAGASASEASDWYAVGAMLHEALTGKLPKAGGLAKLMKAARHDLFESPDFETDLRVLQAICQGLTDPGPNTRWDGRAVLRALNVQPRTSRTSRIEARRHSRRERFVGRAMELATLNELLRGVRAEAPAVACLAGESGIGKSALLARFVADVRAQRNTVVLSGRCFERESIPYKTLDGIMDQLAAFWGQLSPAEAAAILPREVACLTKVFGVLSQVSVVAAQSSRSENDARDPRERRNAAFRDLKELLGRIGDRYTFVIVIDDLQWGDAASARELIQLLTAPRAPGLMLIGAYRSTDLSTANPLLMLLQALRYADVTFREITLPALSSDEVAALATSLSVRPLSADTLSDIENGSRGNPFFVSELVRQVDAAPDRAPFDARRFVQARIERLPLDERTLLELISLSAVPVKLRILREVAGLSERFDATLAGLFGKGLIRSRRGEAYDLVEPYHDRIREQVRSHTPIETQSRYHMAFAAALRDDERGPREVLAAHLEGAGELVRAAEYYGQAAEDAHSGLAFEHAARLLEKCLELRAAVGAPPDGTLLVKLAESLALAGQGPRSARAYEAAAREHSSTSHRDELELRAAEQFLYAGHFDAAMKLLRDVLPRFGIRVPNWPFWLLLIRSLYNGIRILLRRVSSRPTHGASRRAQICATLGDATVYLRPGMAGYFYQEHVLHGFRSAEPHRIALALTSRALLVSSIWPHRFREALSCLDRARALTVACEDPYVRGQLVLKEAVVHVAACRYVETNALARQAELIFRNECLGSNWGIQHSLAWQSIALFYLGRFDDLGVLCRDNLSEARHRGDEMLSKLLSIGSAWVELARDRADEALRIAPEFTPDGSFTILDAGALAMRGTLLAYLGRAEEAWASYRTCAPLVLRTGVLTASRRAYDFHLTRGLVASHLVGRSEDPSVERLLRTDIRALSSARTQDAHAMGKLLEGNMLLSKGRQTHAMESWSSAARNYMACDMRAFAATMRHGVARLKGDDAGAESARSLLEECGIRSPERWTATWCPRLQQHS